MRPVRRLSVVPCWAPRQQMPQQCRSTGALRRWSDGSGGGGGGSRRSSSAVKVYKFEAVSAGKAGCSTETSTGFTLHTDIPRLAGGSNAAAQPVELLLASLLGCETSTAHFVVRPPPAPPPLLRSFQGPQRAPHAPLSEKPLECPPLSLACAFVVCVFRRGTCGRGLTTASAPSCGARWWPSVTSEGPSTSPSGRHRPSRPVCCVSGGWYASRRTRPARKSAPRRCVHILT
jgi:hypothetical protein